MHLKALLAILVAAAGVGCGGPQPGVPTSEAGPSPIVLTDTSAGRLPSSSH
jgi:hypothetical protein